MGDRPDLQLLRQEEVADRLAALGKGGKNNKTCTVPGQFLTAPANVLRHLANLHINHLQRLKKK